MREEISKMKNKKEPFVTRMKNFFRNYGNIDRIYNKEIDYLKKQINDPNISELERRKRTQELKKKITEKKKAKQANVKAFIFGISGALALGATANIMYSNISESMPKKSPSVKITDAKGVDYYELKDVEGSVSISGNPTKVVINGIEVDKASNGNVDELMVNEELENHAKETLKNLRNKI
jgi:flagellar motor protein MotB